MKFYFIFKILPNNSFANSVVDDKWGRYQFYNHLKYSCLFNVYFLDSAKIALKYINLSTKVVNCGKRW